MANLVSLFYVNNNIFLVSVVLVMFLMVQSIHFTTTTPGTPKGCMLDYFICA